jgi:hypothetical protein
MRKLLGFVVALFMAGSAYAAEGDFVAEYGNERGEYIVREYLLCDGDHDVDLTCDEIDLTTVANADGINPYGLPLYVVADVTVDDCDVTKHLVHLMGVSTTGGVRQRLHVTALQFGSITTTVTINPLTHRFVAANVTTAGGTTCTDLEVVLRLFYDRERRRGQR